MGSREIPQRVAWIADTSFAHRGLHGRGIPENSLAAFSAAIEAGYGIECDVQRARDGTSMVFHDWDLDRLTDETGEIARRDAGSLAQIALKGGAEQRIHPLGAVLDLVAGRVPLLIEVKSRKGTRVSAHCLAIRRALEGYRGPHGVMSFDPRVPKWFATHSPGTPRGLVVSEQDDKALPGRIRRFFAIRHAEPDFLAWDVRDLPSRLAASQRRKGRPIATWTVRDAEHRTRAERYADAPIAEGHGFG